MQMSGIIIGVCSGLIVVFLSWIASRLFLNRRLFLIQPKLFNYSDFVNSKNSKIIELTIFNGGYRSEEDVRIELSPNFTYNVLASNRASLFVDSDGILSTDRLVSNQDLTVILTAEGGDFRKEHVLGISSKHTDGKIKENLQDAKFTPAQSLFIPILLFLLLPALGYGVGKAIEVTAWPLVRNYVVNESAVHYGVGNERIEKFGVDPQTASRYEKIVRVTSVRRKGNIVSIRVEINNRTAQRVAATISTSSAASGIGESVPRGVNNAIFDVLIFAGSKRALLVSDYLPPKVLPQIMELKVSFDLPRGRVTVYRDISLYASY